MCPLQAGLVPQTFAIHRIFVRRVELEQVLQGRIPQFGVVAGLPEDPTVDDVILVHRLNQVPDAVVHQPGKSHSGHFGIWFLSTVILGAVRL